MLRFFAKLLKTPEPKLYDNNHPAYVSVQKGDLVSLKKLCEEDPCILTATFNSSEYRSSYVGNGHTMMRPEMTNKNLLSLALECNQEEIALWLEKRCTDKNAFKSSVILGRKSLVEAFCLSTHYQADIAQNAEDLFNYWQQYINFELRQGYVRETQMPKHPCPKDIFQILFRYMSADDIHAMISKIESEKNEKIADLLKPHDEKEKERIAHRQAFLRSQSNPIYNNLLANLEKTTVPVRIMTREEIAHRDMAIQCIDDAFKIVRDCLIPLIDEQNNSKYQNPGFI